MPEHTRKVKELALLGLSAIFLLNDYLFIAADGYITWLVIDYGSRLLALGFILSLVRRRVSPWPEFGLAKMPFTQGLAWAALLTVTGILIDQVLWKYVERVVPATQLISAYPVITNHYVNAFDLTVGIALVAVSEELVFRGYFLTVVKNYVRNPAVLILLSAVVFGLIHWAMGLHAIVTTAIWGVLPMISLMRTGSVLPAIIAHYLTDLVSLSGIVPEAWFQFLP